MDGIAARVALNQSDTQEYVILISDVELRVHMESGQQHPGTGTGTGSSARPSRLTKKAMLTQMVGEALIDLEARRTRAPEPTERQKQAQKRRLEQRAGGPEAVQVMVQRLGVTPGELERLWLHAARVEAFLESNLEGSTSLSRAEVDRAFDRGEHPFVGQTLEQVRPDFERWLRQDMRTSVVRRWFEVLRSRARIWVAPDRVWE